MNIKVTKKRSGDIVILLELENIEALVIRDALEVIHPANADEYNLAQSMEMRLTSAIHRVIDLRTGTPEYNDL